MHRFVDGLKLLRHEMNIFHFLLLLPQLSLPWLFFWRLRDLQELVGVGEGVEGGPSFIFVGGAVGAGRELLVSAFDFAKDDIYFFYLVLETDYG